MVCTGGIDNVHDGDMMCVCVLCDVHVFKDDDRGWMLYLVDMILIVDH